MMDKEQNRTERQTSLFDNPLQTIATERQPIAGETELNGIGLYEALNDRKILKEVLDIINDNLDNAYNPIIDETFYDFGRTYYLNHIDGVQKALKSSGLTETTIQSVTEDYFHALMGNYTFATEPAQMATVTAAITPLKAYLIDNYGFYNKLLTKYFLYQKTLYDYISKVKDADLDMKRDFINLFLENKTPAPMFYAVCWALERDYITLADFAGIEPETLLKFGDIVNRASEASQYFDYYHLCKYAYNVPPEKLSEIRKPKFMADYANTEAEAEKYCSEQEEILRNTIKDYAALADDEGGQEEAKEKAKRWNAQPSEATMESNNVLMQLQSRGVYGSIDQKATEILPIKKFIEGFITDHNIKSPISPYAIEKAIDGVNVMAYDKKGVKPVNGYYTYKTNLYEFSRYCGFADAGQEDKLELFNALRVIDYTMWLVLWTPKGTKAVRVLTITEFDQSGGFTVNVTKQAMAGRPILMTDSGYQKLRKETKGQAKAHFRNQIFTKSHKSEEDLVKECFDYQSNVDMANMLDKEEGTGGTHLKEYLKFWSKHKSGFKKRIASWFEEYRLNGAIIYTVITTVKGEKIYQWEKAALLNPSKGTNSERTPANND